MPQRGTETMPQGCKIPTGCVVPDGSSGSQEQEATPQGRDEVAIKTGTGRIAKVRPAASWQAREEQGKPIFKAETCGLLVGTCKEPQEQSFLIWTWNIQEQHAVVR